MHFRTGFGYDVHVFAPDRQLWLGGVLIPHHQGLLGHSDADVMIHALCDALLGAANLGDIGFHFPDTSSDFKNIDSKILLNRTMELVRAKGYELSNADCTVVAEEPKLSPHIPSMKSCLAAIMQINTDNISIKATTSERVGFVGRKEGVAAYATVLIYQKT